MSLPRVGDVLTTTSGIARQAPAEETWSHRYLELDSGRSSPCNQLSSGGSEDEPVPVESLEHFEPIRSPTLSHGATITTLVPREKARQAFPQTLVHSCILRRLLYDLRNNSKTSLPLPENQRLQGEMLATVSVVS